jgi:hypothetical protein
MNSINDCIKELANLSKVSNNDTNNPRVLDPKHPVLIGKIKNLLTHTCLDQINNCDCMYEGRLLQFNYKKKAYNGEIIKFGDLVPNSTNPQNIGVKYTESGTEKYLNINQVQNIIFQ